MLKNVELFVNNTKPKAIELSGKVKDSLQKYGYNIIESADSNEDIVIGFGGDGTLLKWLSSKNYKTEAKYIGINCGTLGFLQDFDVSDVQEFVKNIPNFIQQRLNFVSLRQGSSAW